MRRVPDGLGIEPYQTMLSDLLGPGSVLALCEGREVLLPADPDGRRLSRIRLALGGEPDAGVVALAVAVPGRDLRLVAAIATRDELPDARERALAEAALRGLAGCVRESWCQCQDLDDMTEELTQRYDELSLIYQMERCGIGRAGEDATSLECIRRLLEDAATHLGVPALVAVAPREELELVVHGRDVEPDPDAVEILRARAARLHRLAQDGEGAVVLNRASDPRRDAALGAVNAKLLAATIGVGEADSGVVAVLRKCEEPDFRSNDRKLLTVLADQIAAYLRGSRDDLTGLLNRRGFERRLGARLRAGNAAATVLHLDLNQFRVLNHTCGRVAGDELLRQVAEVLVRVTREADVVARVGGDEFALLVDECEGDGVDSLAGDLLERVRRHDFVWSGKTQELQASAGVVPLCSYTGPCDPQRVLALAEAACELAAEAGAGRHHVYTEYDEQVLLKRGHVQWVPRIRDALSSDRFELYAQVIEPVVPHPGRSSHQELLLRMRDENGTLVSPAGFIPAAERFQLMSQIDRWVVSHALDTLCREQWAAVARRVVWCINLSGQSLSDERFHAFLLDELARHDFPLDKLCFEVTETAAVENHRAASALMRTLGDRGVAFALDDFGAGMSSFAYLRNLPVSTLKIDGSFVRGLAHDGFSRATVDAVNRVGKALGLVTTAEYVEDDKIFAVLRELGVDYAQGFGLGRPVPLAQTLDRLAGGIGTRGAKVVHLRTAEAAEV